ncbi:hypothetical protein [Leptospira sp. severe_002]|uniref:hypothetical protein n=1 Tax=Leptospira sp. severe_002 TaxID=2838237 RepID=UPI001E4C1F03|nr:hypothetical protein [Leptospira sp. severe_002]
MNFDWIDAANPVAVWWMFLATVSTVNIALWLVLYRQYQKPFGAQRDLFPIKLMLWLCAAYVFGCAFRSFIPRADVQRIVLFDSWISSVMVGRSIATIAEVCFVVQWAIVLRYLGRMTKSDTVLNVSKVIVPMILVAEICSWYAVITTSYLGNTVENSIWAVAFSLIGVALVRLMVEFRSLARIALGLSLVGVAIYVGFLFAVDVPMYFGRWQADMAAGKPLLGLFAGIHDASTHWIVTHDIVHWMDEIAWMSLYFSAAVWSSLLLGSFALIRHWLPAYRVRAKGRRLIGKPVPVRVRSETL